MGSPPPPHAFADRASLVTAVQQWHNDATVAKESYGNISYWDVSRVTDMSSVFSGRSNFSEPLYWDTSSVTTMESMFHVSARRRSNAADRDAAEHALCSRCRADLRSLSCLRPRLYGSGPTNSTRM